MNGFRPRVRTDRDLRRGKSLFSDDAPPKGDDFATRLVNYIPTEVVGAYVVVAGLIEGLIAQDKSFLSLTPIHWLWIAVWSFTVLSWIYMFAATGKPTQWFQVWSAPVAFFVWALALGGPFKVAMKDYNPAGASILLVIVSIAIPVIDKLVDKITKK